MDEEQGPEVYTASQGRSRLLNMVAPHAISNGYERLPVTSTDNSNEQQTKDSGGSGGGSGSPVKNPMLEQSKV
jgi:hypothetical protein